MASRSLPLLRAALRPVVRASPASAARFVAPVAARSAAVSRRAFALSATKFKAVESDGELTASLKEEFEYENADAAEKKTFEAYQENRSAIESLGFKITESAGQDEVVLTKKLDGETITVSFSTSGVESAENPAELEMEEDEEVEQDEGTSFLPVQITITKADDPAALVIETLIEDAQFTISDVLYYKDASLAADKSTQGEDKRRELYDGPAFDHLDPTVQENFQLFVEARGFDEGLAEQIIELQRGKEVKEYISWLDGVRKFIDA